MASKVLLLDGNSLIHRAYHALPHLSTTAGQPTNAAFGFVQMVLPLLQAEQPDVAILALDAPGPTFRHQLDQTYKANRPGMEEDLVAQLPIIRELAEAMGLTTTELPGYEADDIIGTLAARLQPQDAEVVVVSGDRDLAQIVRPGVRLLATLKGMTQTKVYDEAAVRQEFGVPPAAMADLKGLSGDTSDNIPGVPKVGPKTAQELISRFGSLQALYERLDEVENPKLRQRLAEHAAAAQTGKRLATIECRAPVPDGLLQTRWQGLDIPRLRQLLAKLEFTSLLDRLPPQTVEPEDLAIAQTPDEIVALCQQAREAAALGLAVVLRGDRAAGLALAVDENAAVFVPLPAPPQEGQLLPDGAAPRLPDCLAHLLADPQKPKIGHDLKQAAHALRAASLPLEGLAFDTAVASYLLAPHRTDRGVEALVAEYTGDALPPPQAEAARAAATARAVLRLKTPLLRALEEVGERQLFEQVEMPLVTVLRDMELAGIAVDTARLDEIGDKLSGMIAALAQRIYNLAGTPFNIDSPKQLGEVLFDRLKLPRGARTKTGWSTSAEVLEELAPDHEIVSLVLSYREYAKLKSTYVDALIRLVSPADQRVHTTFEQAVATTGRLSSRNPNLQNIPIRTDWGREIRSCFVAQGHNMLLLSADYSQIELRILAHMSGDEALVQAFRAGEDIHVRTAAALFDVPLDAVTPDMRRTAKTVNYAVVYGMGSVALARQLGISRTQAQTFIEHYFQHLPRVKAYMESIVERARQEGYVTTLFGRRRPLPELHSSDQRARAYAERAAANAPLQGTAADIIKIAMVRLAQRLPTLAPRCRMLLQVHDELLFELPEQDVPTVAPLVREIMCGAATLQVPLVVEPQVGRNWRDMTPV